MRVHLADISDSYISGEKKAELFKQFREFNEPAIITISIGALSPDHTQDNAFVQHFNKLLLEFMQKIVADGVQFRVHRARSDGCRGQYKCAHHFYWISRQQAETGVRVDWCFSCSCHGKDLVDPENGRSKYAARIYEGNIADDDEKSLRDTKALWTFLKTTMRWPQTPLNKKGMRGIYCREYWYIPAVGPDAVNRRIKHCDTLEGSNSVHQFEDIGRPGFLKVRVRSCHRCTSCWKGEPSVIMLLYSCHCLIAGNSEACTTFTMKDYKSKIVELKPLTTPERALTRSQLSEEGKTMAATVVPGDFICCEIASIQEPWMIGLAETCTIQYEGPEERTWMGKIMPGDLIVWVTKLEGSGNCFGATEKRVPVFAEDIRLVKFPMKQLATRKSARAGRADTRVFARYELGSKEKASILTSMPIVFDQTTRHACRKDPGE